MSQTRHHGAGILLLPSICICDKDEVIGRFVIHHESFNDGLHRVKATQLVRGISEFCRDFLK